MKPADAAAFILRSTTFLIPETLNDWKHVGVKWCLHTLPRLYMLLLCYCNSQQRYHKTQRNIEFIQ